MLSNFFEFIIKKISFQLFGSNCMTVNTGMSFYFSFVLFNAKNKQQEMTLYLMVSLAAIISSTEGTSWFDFKRRMESRKAVEEKATVKASVRDYFAPKKPFPIKSETRLKFDFFSSPSKFLNGFFSI